MNKKNVNFIADAIHSLTEGMKELTEKVEELKNSIDDGGVSKPEDRERYWYISQAGEADTSGWDNYHVDHDRYAIGNCFPTKQSAEDAVRVLKLIQKARESQDGFVLDWENLEQDKYLFYFHHGNIGVSSLATMNTAPTFGYWRDKSVCEQFIDEEEEEILWFFTEYRR